MSAITTADGTRLHYEDWGHGPPVVFCHGWPLSSAMWAPLMLALVACGFRCIAHDRRGHGRSSRPWSGNDMDGFADDLATLLDDLDLRNVTLVGFSMGGGEVARCVGRHGSERLARVVLIASVTPLLLQTPANPHGLPGSGFEAMRIAVRTDAAQFYRELAAGPFFGANRAGAQVSAGVIDAFWLLAMQASLTSVLDCITAFSATDHTADLERIDVPTLIVHGDDDQIVPIGPSAHRAVTLIPRATLKVYPSAPHGLTVTHAPRLQTDLLGFLRS